MNDYTVIDTETSGLNPTADEIIKLSALKVRNGIIADRFTAFAKPRKPLNAAIERIVGIANDDLSEMPPVSEALSNFTAFIGNDTLVSHNIGFDMKFINNALKNAGEAPLKNKTIDTLLMARKKCRLKNFSLRAVAQYLGVDCENLNDVEITLRVYENLKGIEDLQFSEANANKYVNDGKMFVKEIAFCEAIGKDENEYDLYCKISECGKGLFRYAVGKDFIESYNKKLWLENAALATLKTAIDEYEKELQNIRDRHLAFRIAKWEDFGITLYYEHSAPCGGALQFNIYVEKNGAEAKIVTGAITEGIFAIVEKLAGNDGLNPKENELFETPLYVSAEKYNDKLLIAELKLIYGTPSREEVELLEKIDGIKRLPKLPEQFNKEYVVNYDDKIKWIFRASRFELLHRPNFAMKDCTRQSVTVNPHTKRGVDAAKIDAPSLTVEEFLKIYEQNDERRNN